jgi:outer membrane murein-binding lipoprotein Lpp
MRNFISKYKSEIIIFVIFIVCTIVFTIFGCVSTCSRDTITSPVATTIAATETTEKMTEATETKAKKAKNKNQKKNNEKPKDKVEKTTINTTIATQPTATQPTTTKTTKPKKKNNGLFITAEAASTYPNASKIWAFLKEQGYNDYVCAGIMGNIMAEVGGQTLNIEPYLGNSYYGICQWGGGRKTRLLNSFGSSLEAQLSFLAVELPEVIPTGSSFYSIQNEQQAALYFAQYYERCSSSTYSIRQQNATKAYNYFVR